MATAPAAGSATAAHLGFVAIFNPSLGSSDETVDDQIVYYASVNTQTEAQSKRRRRKRSSKPTEGISQEERHERLRQIGLAQGMASFSRGFADGAAVDAIDTEKSRVVLHELEPGWWILASIDLTKVPLPPRLPTKSGEKHEERFEYSSREMKPASLILSDLLRAHNIFLLHNDSSLSTLFARSRRSKFVAVLSRYWDLYLSTWTPMLHGNPARDIYGGINVAASGELGVGVGEEDRGSGEREVLEGFVDRIEGLVDLVVSKFGEQDPEADSKVVTTAEPASWLGTGREPGAEDGAIFLGTGALSRKSLKDVMHWMEDLYSWGEHAYGVIESPTSVRQIKAPKTRPTKPPVQEETRTHDTKQSTSKTETENQSADQESSTATTEPRNPPPGEEDEGKFDKMVSYLKMGYGTYWSLPGSGTSDSQASSSESKQRSASHKKQPDPSQTPRPGVSRQDSSNEAAGHFLIGLKGDIEEAPSDHESQGSDDGQAKHNSRTVLRTINVELRSEASEHPEATTAKDLQHPASALAQSQVVGSMVPGDHSHALNKEKKLRAVVYVNRPFIFTFLFELRTDSLAWDSLYRSLHYQLAPLKKPLLGSTSYRPERPKAAISGSSILDLVWDPKTFNVHSTIPNIPETYELQGSWSRADALSTHLHFLNIHSATRCKMMELERTQKTSRGWWIVWTRFLERSDRSDPPASLSTIRESVSDSGSRSSEEQAHEEKDMQPTAGKEVFLLRRASDHVGFRSEGGRGGEGAGRLAQGIGVDTRRYIEDLLNLL